MPIVAQFFPNGEFTHGVDTSHRRKERRHKERRHEPLSKECRDRYLQWKSENADIDLCVPGQSYLSEDGKKIWVYTGTDKYGTPLYDCINSGGTDTLNIPMPYPVGRLIGSGRFVPLVYQGRESSPQPPKSTPTPESSRKRLESMTKHMARNIRNGVYLLEQYYGKDQLSFLTLTLPNLSNEDLGLCCERWDYLVDQTLKWIRKRLEKLHIEFEYVYCTEIQTKRLQQRGEYAPHLHCVFRGRNGKKKSWAITPKAIRKAWIAAICSVIGHSNFYGDSCENLQRIRHSAARYLSKYMSKGNCCYPVGDAKQPIQRLRTQWGGMARKLSKAIRAETRRFCQLSHNGHLALRILQNMDELMAENLVKYYRQGFIVTSICPHTQEERGLHVGVGCLQTPTYQGGLVSVLKFLDKLESVQR